MHPVSFSSVPMCLCEEFLIFSDEEEAGFAGGCRRHIASDAIA